MERRHATTGLGNLVTRGFTAEQAARLIALREQIARHQRNEETTDFRRLEFIRWLRARRRLES